MTKARHTAARDYSGLFVGMILSGLVAIVFVLMMAVSQSRARDARRCGPWPLRRIQH